MATLLKSFLYSNKAVYVDDNVDRRLNNIDDINKHSDPDLTYRIAEQKDWVFQKNYHSIPLGMLVHLGLINFAVETDTKFYLLYKEI